MAAPSFSDEQKKLLDRHVAGIGHNQGPQLVAHADQILSGVAKHSVLKREEIAIRVMLDMLRSHLSGEHPLSRQLSGFIVVGLGLVATITGVGIVTLPFETLLLDAPVVAILVATIRNEMESYADWRAGHDPSYVAIRDELYGRYRLSRCS